MTVKVGQVWKENDPRANRHVRVVGVHAKDGKAQIVMCNFCAPYTAFPYAPLTKAALKRFNGKRGGYSLVKDAP
jgi:hypothetical protein